MGLVRTAGCTGGGTPACTVQSPRVTNDSQFSSQFPAMYCANTGKDVPFGAVDEMRREHKLPDKELAPRFTEQRVEVSVAAVPKILIPAST